MSVGLLLVEDDDGIATPLERALLREEYAVTRVATGADALAHIAAGDPPALVILDLGLPDIDGLDVCRQARASGFDGSILILTARGDELDRVVGLDTGADDYMSKPVALAELLARVRALLRRHTREAAAAPNAPTAAGASGDGLRVDEPSRRVFVADKEMHLSAKEYDLLAQHGRETGSVETRERMMEEVWAEHWCGSTMTRDVTLGRLRSKLTDAKAPVEVVAVRGVGFRLESSSE
jgi:DNA-binding response OmpR family regulator